MGSEADLRRRLQNFYSKGVELGKVEQAKADPAKVSANFDKYLRTNQISNLFVTLIQKVRAITLPRPPYFAPAFSDLPHFPVVLSLSHCFR